MAEFTPAVLLEVMRDRASPDMAKMWAEFQHLTAKEQMEILFRGLCETANKAEFAKNEVQKLTGDGR